MRSFVLPSVVASIAASASPGLAKPPCVDAEAEIASAQRVDGKLEVCLHVPDAADDACWRATAGGRWQYASSRPHAALASAAVVTATSTQARVCAPAGTPCREVALAGITVQPDETLAGAANADRSLIAVWGMGPVHVFDAAGKRTATIAPWKTAMNPDGPSVFRTANVLGTTVEVRIADTPITSAIRLYDARGKKLGDVFRGQPMNDGVPPLALGGADYLYQSFDLPRRILVVDVATGKQRARYAMPGPACPRQP